MNPDWDEAAYDALADAWVLATPEERERIEAAVIRAEQLLRDAAQFQGESRTGSIRVMFVDSLTVYYRFISGVPARVIHVRFVRPRQP